jgi:hypothetical protein
MTIILEPPVGLPPLLLGMDVDAAEGAMRFWGTPERLKVPEGAPPQLTVRDEARGLHVMAFFEDGASLTAIELMRPDRPDVTVLWEGIDIFGQSDEEVLAALGERGFAVDPSDPLHPYFDEITLGFDRDHERGYFESVLVARPGYYDADLPGIWLPTTDPDRPLG